MSAWRLSSLTAIFHQSWRSVASSAAWSMLEPFVADDGGVEDGSPTVVDCNGKTDGTECGPAQICLKNECKSSSCGDGYVNLAFDPRLELQVGQFKKPFSRLELTSSSRIVPIEFGLRIRHIDDTKSPK